MLISVHLHRMADARASCFMAILADLSDSAPLMLFSIALLFLQHRFTDLLHLGQEPPSLWSPAR